MNKKEKMYAQIEEHGKNLIAMFGLGSDANPVKISKRLFSLEYKARRLAEQFCNGDIDIDKWDVETAKILAKVDKLTGYKSNGVPVFVNGDCRGYALKIAPEYVRAKRDACIDIHRDFGGNGILAPDFRDNN